MAFYQYLCLTVSRQLLNKLLISLLRDQLNAITSNVNFSFLQHFPKELSPKLNDELETSSLFFADPFQTNFQPAYLRIFTAKNIKKLAKFT